MSNDSGGAQPRSRRRKLGIGGTIAIVSVVAYVTAIFLYSQSGKSETTGLPAEVSSGVNVSVDLVALDPGKNQMVLRIGLIPSGPEYLNAEQVAFAQPLRVTIWGQTNGSIVRNIPAGEVFGAFESTLYIEGSPETYPFDTYQYADLVTNPDSPTTFPFITIEKVNAATGNSAAAKAARVVPIGVEPQSGGLQGWSEEWNFKVDGNTLELDLLVKHSGGVLAFVLVVLSLMVVIAALAMMVSTSVVKRRRPIEATMASWFAALLFALIPLRNFLPASPPIGAWIDIAVVFWVELALLAAMSLFIGSWLAFRKPPIDASDQPSAQPPAQPAPPASSADPKA